jgi:DNA-binding Lrp family transcriptional regulator
MNIEDDESVKMEGYDEMMSTYYSDEQVKSLITMRVDTKLAEDIALKISEYDCIVDAYMVTGDIDIIAKTIFNTYKELKEFIVNDLGKIEGIKNTNTLMVVSTFKEHGKSFLD